MKKHSLSRLFSVAALAFAIASPAYAGQNPIRSNVATDTSGYGTSLKLDAQSDLKVNSNGTATSLNITAATVVKEGVGRIVRFMVTTAGAAGAIYDAATTGTGAAANLIAVMPATVGIYELNVPVSTGILVIPGASQVVSTSYQ